jgi:hypothetical protein
MPRAESPVKLPPYRPTIPIDWEKVDELLEYGCTGVEIAARLGITGETLYERTQREKGASFSLYANEKRAKGDTLLREYQFKQAKKGNITMLIWLGKQRLGQKENPGGAIIPEQIVELFAETMKTLALQQARANPELLEGTTPEIHVQIDLNNEDTNINNES